jgi:hypothetical protein
MPGLRARMFAFRGRPRALAELHTRHVDMVAGYDKILEVAEPEFEQIAHAFRTLHVRQANTIAAMLVEDGQDPSLSGSVFGRLNRAVVTVRSWFEDISTNMIEALIEGEMHVIEALDAALETMPESERRRLLVRFRSELVALLELHERR